jgi:hypothetical protein
VHISVNLRGGVGSDRVMGSLPEAEQGA